MGGLMTLLLVIMMTGGKMSASLVEAVIDQRKQTYERWKVFIEFLAKNLYNLWMLVRGPAKVTDEAGNDATSNEAIMKALTEGGKDRLGLWFYNTFIDTGIKMVFEIMKPSAVEERLMLQILANKGGLGGGGQPTPNQIRASGGGGGVYN